VPDVDILVIFGVL